jgi:ubiquinone/menaquinone biosynthesis C-methylase UbiE
VGFYSQVIFPRLCDFLLDQPYVAKHRRELLARASGKILEIGFGTGLNLPQYPAHVRRITTVDPNRGMHHRAQKRVQQTGIEVDSQLLSSERLPFDDSAFDCVVSTFTLCSIDDVSQALREVHRVLKLGGQFLYLEHGLSPESGVQKWQRRLNWLQGCLGDGCRLDRNIRALIAAQAFAVVESNEFYMEKTPRTHGYMYRGIATK